MTHPFHTRPSSERYAPVSCPCCSPVKSGLADSIAPSPQQSHDDADHRGVRRRRLTNTWCRPSRHEVRKKVPLARNMLARVPEHRKVHRSEEHTSELQSLTRTPYAVFCLKKK